MPPTHTAAPRRIHRRPTTLACSPPTATWCDPPTPCDPTTAIAARRVRRCARCSTTTRGSAWSRTSRATSLTAFPTKYSNARAFEYWKTVDDELGERIEQAVGANVGV